MYYFSKNMQEDISKILDQLNEKIISAIDKTMKSFSEETNHYLSTVRKLELKQFCETLLGYGWIIFNFLPLDIYKVRFDSVETTDAYMEQFCKEEDL